MKELRQVFSGILAAVLSVAITFGGLYLAFVEGGQPQPVFSVPTEVAIITQPGSPLPGLTFTPAGSNETPVIRTATGLPSATVLPGSLLPGTPTLTVVFVLPPTAVVLAPVPSQSTCPPPAGWSPITVQLGDTLDSLAQAYSTTPEALAQANCLITTSLTPGAVIYVPWVQPTASPEPCGPPYGWVFYTVRPGDTLYRISLMFGVTVNQLQRANCMGSSTFIRIGQNLYVPNVTPRTPFPPPATIPPTYTPSQPPPNTPTFTPAFTPTYAPTRTSTPWPSNTPTPEPADTATPTPQPTDTSTPTSTVTDTPTPEPTNTPTPEPTNTPTSTPTPAPTETPAPQPTETPIPTSGTPAPPG